MIMDHPTGKTLFFGHIWLKSVFEGAFLFSPAFIFTQTFPFLFNIFPFRNVLYISCEKASQKNISPACPIVFVIHNEAKAYKSLLNFPSNMISHIHFFQIFYSDKALRVRKLQALVLFCNCIFHLKVPENNSGVTVKVDYMHTYLSQIWSQQQMKFGHNSRLFNLQNMQWLLRIKLMVMELLIGKIMAVVKILSPFE